MARQRVRHGDRRPPALAAACLVLGFFLSGCASNPPGPPPLELSVALDKTQYNIGDPLIATVRLNNRGTEPAILPRFDQQTLRFIVGLKGLSTRIFKEPVSSDLVQPEPRLVAPGRSVERPFLFTRATDKAGEYALIVSVKGVILGDTPLDDTIFSLAAAFTVTDQVALRRDPASGLVLKEQAIEIARQHVKGEIRETRAVLVPLGESGLFTWIIFLDERDPDGKERQTAVRVDPYLGKVRPLDLKLPEPAIRGPGPADGPASGETKPK